MLNDPVLKGLLHMADEMLAAGAKELKDAPEQEDPRETVARIYTAMELVRIMLEHLVDHDQMTAEEKAKKLN